MESKFNILGLIRRVCLLAVLGFFAIVLAGPILALVSVVTSFALIGFLFWLPFHLLTHGRKESLEKFQGVLQRGGRCVSGVCATAVRVGRDVQAAVCGTASFIGSVLLEALSGAVVAVLLVTTCWPQQSVTPSSVSLAVVIGAAVGLLVVLSRVRLSRGADHSPEPAN